MDERGSMKKLLAAFIPVIPYLAFFFAIAPTPAAAQCNGVFPSNNVCGSVNGGPPSATTITNFNVGTVTSVAAGCGTTTFGGAITTTGVIASFEPPNPQAGTTYAIANADCGFLTYFTSSSAIAVSLAAPSGSNFVSGWYNDLCARGTGTATITATGATINGSSTLALTTGQCARITSDGVNYQLVSYSGGGGGGTPGGASTDVQFNSSGTFGGDSGFIYAGNGQATLALGTITANEKALNITGTFNSSGTTFDAPLFMNITNTASGGSSLLADLQVGGTSEFTVSPSGVVGAKTGFFPTNGSVGIGGGLGNSLGAAGNGVQVGNGNIVAWAFSGLVGSAGTILSQDTSNATALALLNANNTGAVTNPAALHVYNTSDTVGGAPTNYERGAFDWTTTTNVLTIGTQKGGTGSTRNVQVVVGGTGQLDYGITNSGDWTFASPIVTKRIEGVGTPTQSASACAGFSAATGSTDLAGKISYTSATTCTIAFAASFTNAPFCTVTPGSAASTSEAVTTTTTLAVTFGTAQTAFYYHCMGI